MREFAVIGSIFAVVFGVLFYVAYREDKEWEQFKIDHKCRVVAKISGDTFNTFSVDSKGNPVIGVGATSEKTGYACDDGITYYR